MPVFEYRCCDCSERFEILTKSTVQDGSINCPKCNSQNSKKLFSTFSTQSTSHNEHIHGGCSDGSCDMASPDGCSSGMCGLN